MANIIVQGKQYNNVPAVNFPKVGGGVATYTEGGGSAITVVQLNANANGTYNAPADTAYNPVVVSVTPTLQSKTVNPSTSQQTVSPDSGYDGLSSVTVNAIPIGSATTPYTEIVENPVINVYGNGLIEAVVQHRESVTPTVVAGYVASGTAGDVDVDGYSTHQLSTQAGTTITPTESQQTAVASGKYTTGAVLVGAISSSYVGSGITRRDSTDLSASGDTVTVPSGYYANSASKAVSSGSATTPSTTIRPPVNISVSNSGLISATAQDYEDITPTVVAGYISSGTSGRVYADAHDTYQLPTQPATTYTPTTSDQTISSGKYLTGVQTISGDANLVSGNIKSGVSIFGVLGNAAGYVKLGEKDFTANTTSTTAISLGNLTLSGSSIWTSSKIIYISIRDKAGKREGYLYGTDAWFVNANPINGSSTTSISTPARMKYTYSSSGEWIADRTTTVFGVYVYDINSSGRIRVYARYDSTHSLTINGTYHMEVYALDFPNGAPMT